MNIIIKITISNIKEFIKYILDFKNVNDIFNNINFTYLIGNSNTGKLKLLETFKKLCGKSSG